MKYFRLFVPLFVLGFFLASFASPNINVIAQVPTLTATNTFIPPTVTPTSVDFACPIGTPAGWGTYTPSPLWFVQCSGCSSIPTGTAEPTFTPNPTYVYSTQAACQTAAVGGEPCNTPTVQPTMTITATIAPTGTSLPNSNRNLSYINTTFGTWAEGYITYIKTFQVVTNQSKIISVSGTIGYVDNHDLFTPDITVTLAVKRLDDGTCWQTHPYYYSITGDFDQTKIGDVVVGSSGVWSPQQFGCGDETLYFRGRLLGTEPPAVMGDSVQFPYTITVSTNPISTQPTATPTGTPYFDTGYCSSVAPTIAEFGFDLFVPDGEPNCNMGWDEFGVGEYTIPAAQICFQPSKFGVIRLFNEDYEVGVYGLAAAAAFIYRFFRTV